jgi:superfamily II DNA/RNA helicase
MSGEDDDKTRLKITERFRTEDNTVLISTDAAAEGLNLQQRCHYLIHLELPFNPNRLEQRNGRIDRYGQTQEPIVRYLYLRGTFEERILLRLIAKYERQRAKLTFVPDTLGLTTTTDAASERLLKGLMDEDARLFQQQDVLFDLSSDREVEGADEATRELLEEIDRSLKGFQTAMKTHAWLAETGLNAEDGLLKEADQARVAVEPDHGVRRVRHIHVFAAPVQNGHLAHALGPGDARGNDLVAADPHAGHAGRSAGGRLIDRPRA